jgi:hypothetical protein
MRQAGRHVYTPIMHGMQLLSALSCYTAAVQGGGTLLLDCCQCLKSLK